MTVVSIGIGSNVGDPVGNVQRAIEYLQALDPGIRCSRLFWTKPWGYTEQADFCNAAAVIDVDLSAHELLNRLQTIEKAMGREREIKWGPRVIDLDLLTFGDEKIAEPDLIVPHPHMMERVFVLLPLCDVLPEYSAHLANFTPEQLSEVVPI